MAEGRRLPLAAGFSATLGSVSEYPAVAFVLRWYGVPLTALFGLVTALYYLISLEVLRPTFDDSYITLNFARNLAEHGKLSFDGDAWTTGATSPLHVGILALLLKLGADPFYASAAVGVAGHVLLAVGVYWLALAIFHSRLAGILGALAIAGTSYAAFDAGNGLETPLFMALVAFVAAAYFWSDRPAYRILCGGLIALAVLTRPEGALLIPAFVIYRWVDRPEGERVATYLKDVLRLALPGAIAGGLIVVFSLIVSGSVGGTGGAKLSFFQEDEESLRFKFSLAADQIGLFIGPVIPLLILAAVVSGRRQAVLVALFWVPVLLFYVLLFPGGLAHYFYRYQHPLLPFLAAFAGGGAAYLVAVAKQRDYVVKALVAIALLFAVVPMYVQYDRWRDIYTAAATEVHVDLEAMAIDLNTIIEPDQTLATHDIGAVGYFADYEVIDLVGLVNEEVIEYHDQRRLREYIERVQPDYLLIFNEWDRDYLNLDVAEHPEQYELVKEYQGAVVRWQTYFLYRMHYE